MLDDESLTQLADHSTLRRFRRGQVLMAKGDPAEALLVLAEGRIKILEDDPDGGMFMLRLAGAGETIGELALLDDGVRSATALAITDGVAVSLRAERFRALVHTRPEFAEHLLRLLASRIRSLTREAADLALQDIPRRLARVLTELHDASHDPLELELTQTDLAQRVGATRQSVNVALRHFERRGWVTRESGRLRVDDATGLREFAAR